MPAGLQLGIDQESSYGEEHRPRAAIHWQKIGDIQLSESVYKNLINEKKTQYNPDHPNSELRNNVSPQLLEKMQKIVNEQIRPSRN